MARKFVGVDDPRHLGVRIYNIGFAISTITKARRREREQMNEEVNQIMQQQEEKQASSRYQKVTGVYM